MILAISSLFFKCSGPNFKRKNLHLNISVLINKLADLAIKKIRSESFNTIQLKSILSGFIKNKIGDRNYYELLSVEAIKLFKNIDNKNFGSIYFNLASANIESKNLAINCTKNIREYLNEFEKGILELFQCQ